MRTLDEHLCSDKQCEKLIELGFEEEYTISLYYELSYLTSRKDGILRSQALDFFRDKGYILEQRKTIDLKYYYYIFNQEKEIAISTDMILDWVIAESALIDKLIELEMEVQNGK